MPSSKPVKPFRILETRLVNLTTGEEKALSKYTGEDTGMDLISLVIKESMFSPSLEGEATLRDYGTAIEDLNLYIGNYDIFRAILEEFVDGESNLITVDLSIYAYSQETSEVESQLGNKNIARLIKLKLASREHYLLNYDFFDYMDSDKVLRISEGKKGLTTEIPEETETQEGQEETQDPEQGEEEIPKEDGLVEYLIQNMNNSIRDELSRGNIKPLPLVTDKTKNWVWLKKYHNFYPWGKFTKPPRLSQLFQLLAENAVDEKNEFAANFFFWQGLDAWYFRSVEAILREQKEKPVITYYLTGALNEGEAIRKLHSGSDNEIHVSSSEETDFFDLLQSYAFGSYYTFVEPKYAEDPYAKYLDTQGNLTYIDIEYDYFEDKDKWLKIEGDLEITSEGSNRNEVIKNISKNAIVDKVYGYFNTAFFNRQKKVPWEYYGYDRSNREDDVLWQTQFDITDMKGEVLKKIQDNIKTPLRELRSEYAKKKNLKEKWKVYKCSVCCAGESIEFTEQLATGKTSDIQIFSLTKPEYEQSHALRNNSSLSNYEIVAAGSFTDVLNYDALKVGAGITGFTFSATGATLINEDGSPVIETTQTPWTISGMTLSYNLQESPYNLSLGEFLSLEKDPSNFVRYRFDLEIRRHEKLRQILLKNKQTRALRIDKYQTAVSGYTYAYQRRSDACNAGCTGYCVCPTEYPETVVARSELVTNAHQALIEHEDRILAQIPETIDKLNALKGEFIALYNKYWSRKAFFFSRNIDFSFLKSGNNLFNVKSVTRKPIRGSKYEPFAIRRPVGNTPINESAPAGSSCGYPYEVPPYVDDLGFFNSKDIFETGFDPCSITGGDNNVYYNRGYDYNETKEYTSDFWSSFDSPYSNFPYSEESAEKAKGPIWYRNWLVSYQISILKPPCLNRKPPCFDGDCSCDEIVLDLNMHFESFANKKDANILVSPTQTAQYAQTQLSKNCDGCKIRVTSVSPASEIKLYHPWAADEVQPEGQEFTEQTYVDYKRSSSLFKGRPGISGSNQFDDGDIPPHLVLEGLESYVRVEFQTPIGTDSLVSFPEGFIDTHGSEYFMPYIVLATAGPFGAQSARANISVIGQDPYGFDLAVKKIKNRDDFSGMNLVFAKDDTGKLTDPTFEGQENAAPYPDLRTPFSTSSSWMKTSQNSLFYKPKDGIADLFVPNGIQDIFMASAMERSFPAKTWWDMWVSLPPIAVSTFYNRHDVAPTGPGDITAQSIAFYSNGSVVAEPFLWDGTTGCVNGCSDDPPWPLFLHPDTEQIISGAFPSNAAVTQPSDLLESSGSLGTFEAGLSPGISASILPSDPSNYVYNFAEFPHIVGMGPTGPLTSGYTGIRKDKEYPVISYPVGTLIWGKDFASEYELTGVSGGRFYDYNFVHYYDISRKTQYGLVQLSSDSMPSLMSLISGVGGNIEKVQEYQKWISRKLIDWFQNTIFDNNFSGQFVVLGKSDVIGCKGYQCMNPGGFPGMGGCPSSDPLCKCPCQGAVGFEGKAMSTYIKEGDTVDVLSDKKTVLRPDLMDMEIDRVAQTFVKASEDNYGYEPSNLELQYLEKKINECELIESELGPEYLGCVYDDPKSPYNCTCPHMGSKFMDYVKYNKTYSTFWETPLKTPLFRTAQMALLNSNKITITVPGDLQVKAGQIINIQNNFARNKRFGGRWLVTTIKRYFNRAYHMMELTLSREGGPKEVENDTET